MSSHFVDEPDESAYADTELNFKFVWIYKKKIDYTDLMRYGALEAWFKWGIQADEVLGFFFLCVWVQLGFVDKRKMFA